jgi:branched-chain amino acid transport system permease protein
LPFSPTPPQWTIRWGGPALALVAAWLGLFVFTPAFRLALANTLIGIIICLSIVVITGYVGQISLAQMSFAGISAFLVAKLTTEHNMIFPLPILFGGLVAMAVGVVVSLPALRVRGVNLAIVTLAFAVAVDKAIFSNKSVNGGFQGAPVKAPKLIVQPRDVQYKFLWFKMGDGNQPNPMTAIFCLIVVVIMCYAVANLRRSGTGRRMLATRSNERAAAAAGVNVSGMKVLAFAVSAFIAGVGGAVSAYRFGSVTPDKFNYVQSLTFFAFAYIGGIASVYGAISGGFLVAGGLVFTFLANVLGVPPEFTLILGGLGLIIASIQNPEGIAGAARLIGLDVQRRLGARKSAAPPPSTPSPPPSLVTASTGGH